jgi:hypothetical protein
MKICYWKFEGNTHVPLWAQQHMVDRHYSLNLKPWSARTLYVHVIHADLAQKYSVGLQEIFVSRLCSQEENSFFLALKVDFKNNRVWYYNNVLLVLKMLACRPQSIHACVLLTNFADFAVFIHPVLSLDDQPTSKNVTVDGIYCYMLLTTQNVTGCVHFGRGELLHSVFFKFIVPKLEFLITTFRWMGSL